MFFLKKFDAIVVKLFHSNLHRTSKRVIFVQNLLSWKKRKEINRFLKVSFKWF